MDFRKGPSFTVFASRVFASSRPRPGPPPPPAAAPGRRRRTPPRPRSTARCTASTRRRPSWTSRGSRFCPGELIVVFMCLCVFYVGFFVLSIFVFLASLQIRSRIVTSTSTDVTQKRACAHDFGFPRRRRNTNPQPYSQALEAVSYSRGSRLSPGAREFPGRRVALRSSAGGGPRRPRRAASGQASSPRSPSAAAISAAPAGDLVFFSLRELRSISMFMSPI